MPPIKWCLNGRRTGFIAVDLMDDGGMGWEKAVLKNLEREEECPIQALGKWSGSRREKIFMGFLVIFHLFSLGNAHHV